MKRKVILIVLGIFIILTSCIGITYASWNYTATSQVANLVTSGCLKLDIEDELNNINLQNSIPITNEEGMNLTPYTFTVENTCSTIASYTLNLESLSRTTLDSNYVRTSFNGNASKLLSEYELMTTTTINGAIEGRILDSGILAPNQSKSYSLRVWLDGDITMESNIMGKVFSSKVSINAIPIDNPTVNINFNSNGGVGTMDPIGVTIGNSTTLTSNTFTKTDYNFKGWSTNPDGTGTYYKDGATISNVGDNITLYAIWHPSYEDIYYEGECVFSGKNVALQGTCAAGDAGGYIRTNITPFSDNDYLRNFELSFTITEITDERMNVNKRDTYFNALYDSNTDDKGIYPGITMRIDSKTNILIQGGAGYEERTKEYFTKDQIVNKEIRIIRYNDGTNNIIYYKIGDGDLTILKDVTDLYATFDTPLLIGASMKPTGVVERHAITKMSNIKFEYLDYATSLEEIVNNN